MSTDDKPVDIKTAFDDLFDDLKKSQDDWGGKPTTLNEQRNEDAKGQFERTKAQRDKRLGEEFRIRKIVAEEQNKLVGVLGAFGFAAAMGYQYGGWVTSVIGIAIWAWHWNTERKAKLKPDYMLGEIDELAEDTVTHERIVALENSGKRWIIIDEKSWPEAGEVFDYPYWKEVNARVRDYQGKNHKERLANNQAARAASLPFRQAKDAQIRSLNSLRELPYWCEIRFNEIKN